MLKSGDTIRNYIALTQLVPELQQMVDEKKIALSPAYQLAALTPKEQGLLLETIDSEQTTPSLSQAQRMKKLSQSGELNEDTVLSIMMEQKKPENVVYKVLALIEIERIYFFCLLFQRNFSPLQRAKLSDTDTCKERQQNAELACIHILLVN